MEQWADFIQYKASFNIHIEKHLSSTDAQNWFLPLSLLSCTVWIHYQHRVQNFCPYSTTLSMANVNSGFSKTCLYLILALLFILSANRKRKAQEKVTHALSCSSHSQPSISNLSAFIASSLLQTVLSVEFPEYLIHQSFLNISYSHETAQLFPKIQKDGFSTIFAKKKKMRFLYNCLTSTHNHSEFIILNGLHRISLVKGL